MIAPAPVHLTINDKPVDALPGQTVLQAAVAAGIDIPTLCNHPMLGASGACRMCLVEIEKQRALQPSCTFPVADGMIVRTETPKVVEARKFALQMLFSERPHYCMFCPMAGGTGGTDCELQMLAYRYGLTHWNFAPNTAHPWPVDASRRHFVMDHSRCVLCRRCIRACGELAASHTLGVRQRGARTMVCADDGVQFDQSTCVSCGTCLQICPTGALIDRNSAFAGRETEVSRAKATCLGCAVGCGMEAITRDGQLLRVEGDWSGNSGGLLCVHGRFETVTPPGPRITTPLVRRDARLHSATWAEALDVVATRLQAARRPIGLISPNMTARLLAGFSWFFAEALQSNEVALLYGQVPPLDVGRSAALTDLAASDCILVIGCDPLKNQKVVGYLTKRAYDAGAKVIVVCDHATELDRYAYLRLELQDISHAATISPFERLRLTYHLRAGGLSKVRSLLEAADRPVVLYGPGLSPTLYAALRSLPPKVHFLPLVEGANAIGADRLGLETRPLEGDAAYIILGDDRAEGRAIPACDFTVVQSAYHSDLTAAADVVLPARTWYEKPGHVVNIERRKLAVVPLASAPRGVQADLDTLLALSVRLGRPLAYEEIDELASAV